MIVIRKARREDAQWLSSRLRPEDASEIEAATRKTPKEILPLGFDISKKCYTVFYSNGFTTDTHPCAIFGVADDREEHRMGVVWMLATPRFNKCWLAFMKAAPKLLDGLAEGYEWGLHNIVDARNILHIRWLQKTGFAKLKNVELNGYRFIHAARFNKGITRNV